MYSVSVLGQVVGSSVLFYFSDLRFPIMKCATILALLVAATPAASAEESNPLGKVFELMSALEAKIVKEGEAEAKAFKDVT